MRWLLFVVVVTACGGSSSPADDTGDDTGADVIGQIQVTEYELGASDNGYITATFLDRGDTADLANDGTCRVYPYPCLGQVGACGSPVGHSAGRLTLTGLTVPITMDPGDTTNGYYANGVPDDVFAPTATITATAAGDEVAAFTVSTTGVDELVSPYVDTNQPAFGAAPVTFTWTGSSDARVSLRVNWADLCHAGADWYILECDAPDTGSLTVSPSVSSALPTPNYGGCGATLMRYRKGVVSDAGRHVELIVGNADYFNVAGAF